MHLETDYPHRFDLGAEIHTDRGGILRVAASRPSEPGKLLVRFEGVEDRSAAEALRGTVLVVPAERRRPLGDDEFWPDELIGLEVRLVTGAVVGSVVDVVEGPAQHRLVIETLDGTVSEVPFVVPLVPRVDVEAGFLTVVEMEGLL